MLSFEEFKNRRREQEAKKSKRSEEQSTPWHDFAQSSNAKGYKAWQDWKGNVNLSDLNTGETNRFYQAYNHIGGADSNRSPAMDSLGADLGQTIGGALQRQGANYKSAGATLLLGAAGLLHGDNNYQPEVGSWLWRMTEGAEADTGVANKLIEDSKYGRGWLGRFAMDLTSGAVDLAGDQLLNLVAPGANMAAMAIRSFGGSAEEQRQQGKSISTQFFKGLKSAAIEYGTEKFAGIGGRSIEGGGYIDNLLSQAEESIVRKGGNAFLTKLGFAFGSEAVEEMMSDWLNPLADKFLAGVVKGDYDIEDFPSFAEVAYDGLIGGALGLLGGAREGLQAQSRVRSMGGNQGYADFLAGQRAETKREVKKAKTAKRAQLKAIFDYATHHAEQAMDRAKTAKAEQASQTPSEAQSPVGQQITPPAPEVSEKGPSREFNSNVEADTTPAGQDIGEAAPQMAPTESPVEGEKKTKPIGKKTARDIAFDAWFNDNVRQDAEPEGVAVDASDFADVNPEVSTKEAEGAKLEEKPRQTNEERIAKSRESALAQNGIDYGYDPRADLEIDPDTGTYREFEPHDMSEEDWQQHKKDLAQARLLDSVDRWLAKNTDSYLDAEYGTLDQKHERLQKALNNYVRDQIDQRQANPEAGEASREVAEEKAAEARLKGKQRSQKYTENGYTVVPIGNELYRVTGPGGRTTEVVATSSADAIQKYNDNLTEESRKAAKERKAKGAELEKMRKDVIESGESPARVDGSDGITYEVTKQFSNEQQTRYEYVVTELDEDGLPSDREARVFQNRANTNEEAVQYAIDNDLFKEDDYSDLTEGSNDGGENLSVTRRLVDDLSKNDRQSTGGEEPEGRSGSSVDEGVRSGKRPSELGVSSSVSEDGGVLQESEKDRIKSEKLLKIYYPDATVIQLGTDKLADEIRKEAIERGASSAVIYDAHADGTIAFVRGGIFFANLNEVESFLRREPGGVDFLTNHEALHQVISKLFGRENTYSIDAKKESKAVAAIKEKFFSLYNELREKHGELAEKAFFAYAISDDGFNGYDLAAENALSVLELFGNINDVKDRGRFLEGYVAEEMLVDIAAGAKLRIKDRTSISDAEYNALRKTVLDIFSREFFNGADTSDIKAALKKKAADSRASTSRDISVEADNAKEYAYKKKLEAEEAGTESSDEDKAKSTFGKDYEKVQKSADDFDGIKTRFDDEAFQKSDKGQDKKTRNKLKKLREAFRNAATTGDVETLFSIYEDLQSDSNLSNFYNEEIQEDIDNWRKLIDPNLDSYNEGAAPYAAARTMQRMAHKFKLANEYQQTLSKMNETLRGSKNSIMRKIGKSEKLTSAVARALVRWQINPDTVFKMIDAFDKGNAGEGYKLAKELQEAHREKYRVLREARAKFDKASDLKGYQDFAFGKQTVKDYSGREWDMRSALSVIKAIDTIRSTSGKKLGGTDGFGVMDSKGNIKFIDMKDVDAIKLYESLKSGLSDVAIKYGELATEAFNDVKEPLRAKYKQNNGVDIGMVGDEDARLGDKKGIEKAVYSPLSYVDKNGNVYQFDIAKQETYNNVPRFLRERSDAGGTYILIKPYTEVTGKYFEQVSNYLAYSTFNEKMRGLGKGSSYESGLGNTLADVFGKDMGNWYRSYVEDLGSYHNEDDVEGVNSLLRQGRQQLQQGALLFSVSVPMKQISSYWAASGILHPDSLIKNYRIKLLKPKNSSDAATMLASRAMGNLEQSAAEAANDAKKWLGKLKYSSKFIELAANAINQMDYNTVSNLLSATEYDVLKYQFGGDKSVIGTDEYRAAVEEKFQDVVDRSQPNFDKQMRAEYGRTDNEVIRMLSMFRTQQTQNLNLLATAIGEYQASKGTANQAKATETLKQTIAGQAASAFSLSMLTILADMLLHRQKKYEDEEQDIDMSKVLTRLGINAIEASSGTLWFGDAVAKWAIDRISGGSTKEFYGVNMGVISTVSDILENFETAIKSPTRSNIKKCAGNIATIMGIPLNNAYSMLNSAIMYAKDLAGDNEGDYDDILRYLDAQTKAAKKEEQKAAKEAAKSQAKSGADMLADTAKQSSSQSELNSAEEQKAPEVSTYLKKPYNALVEAGMTPERSQYVLDFMDTDNNDSIKQSEMWAFYKDNPDYEDYVIAMWNSYGYKTTWEAYKAKHK